MTKSKVQFAALILVVPFGFLIVTVLLIALGVQWIALRLLRVAPGVEVARSHRPTTSNR